MSTNPPPLPAPDCRTDDNRDGEGEDAYTPALVRRVQREAYEAGMRDSPGFCFVEVRPDPGPSDD